MAMLGGWPPWLRALKLLHEEAAGVCWVVPMMAQEIEAALKGALADPPDARSYLLAGALTVAHEQVERPAPDTVPMVCVGCTRPLAGHPRSFAIVVPDVPEPQRAVALAVCPTCGPDPNAIRRAVQPCLRIIWPDLRQLGGVSNAVGHA
jgi:hypothetical protein